MHWRSPAATALESENADPDLDAALMLRFKEGDVEAFEELFARHSRALVNFAYRFVRSRAVAEELAQDIFLRVHDAAPGYAPTAKFTTWLYRIASNVCLNEVRRPRHRHRHEPLDEPPDRAGGRDRGRIEDTKSVPPDRRLQQLAVSAALRRSLEAIPDKQRLAFVLNKYEHLSYAEVAEVMKVSEKAVKSLIHRARESLVLRLKPLLPELM